MQFRDYPDPEVDGEAEQPAETRDDLIQHRKSDWPRWRRFFQDLSIELTGAKPSSGKTGMRGLLEDYKENNGYPVSALLGPPKTDESLDQKLEKKNPRVVTDLLRGSVICDSPESMVEAVTGLRSFLEDKDIRVAECTNRFSPGRDLSGYRDINMLLELPGSDGYLVELQIHASDVWVYKENRGHLIYKDVERPGITFNEREAMKTRMKQGNDAAFKQWLGDENA